MVDFLKANPFVTMDDYKWKLSVPMIRLMAFDNTSVRYLSEKQKKRKNATIINSVDDLYGSLGVSKNMISKNE